ncbi:hypothetical protein MIDIC_470038 [Alphaproteobacteria bacterium]
MKTYFSDIQSLVGGNDAACWRKAKQLLSAFEKIAAYQKQVQLNLAKVSYQF